MEAKKKKNQDEKKNKEVGVRKVCVVLLFHACSSMPINISMQLFLRNN